MMNNFFMFKQFLKILKLEELINWFGCMSQLKIKAYMTPYAYAKVYNALKHWIFTRVCM